MFEDLYIKLTKTFPYKLLIFIPVLFSFFMIFVIFFQGIPLSIDFQGGTWIEVAFDQTINENELQELHMELDANGLKDLKVLSGKDLETNKQKVTIITSSLLDETQIIPLLEKHVGEVRTKDIAIVNLSNVSIDKKLEDKLRKRFEKEGIIVNLNTKDSTISIMGFDLNEEEIENTFSYYLNSSVSLKSFKERNLILDKFDPFLGKDFWRQGMRALFVAYLIMIFIVFFAFRDFIPSIAVILAATCDVIIAAGFMSIFGIQLDPASLTALLMLIGYSVDSDIMLTSRVLKIKTGEVNERLNSAMKTGLTMTFTTMTVMAVILVISTMLINQGLAQIEKLYLIASVLFLGLIGDLMTTWFMNAGILKWYVEEKGGKFSFLSKFSRIRKWRRKRY
jgi:preprotein translocase subunit SecF